MASLPQVAVPTKPSGYGTSKETLLVIPVSTALSVISGCRVVPAGKIIVSGSIDGTLNMWDRQGKPLGDPSSAHTRDESAPSPLVLMV